MLCLVIGNHDEPRAIEHFGSWWRSTAAALLTFTMPVIDLFFFFFFEVPCD